MLLPGLSKNVSLAIARAFRSHDPEYSRAPIDALTALAVIYMALPNLAFLFGWLQLPVAAPLAAGLIASLWQLLRRPTPGWRVDTLAAWLLALAAIWCLFGGAGHFMYANKDWHIRDAVYGDLIFSQWPPAYLVSNDHALVLRSAVGYFLIPALITDTLGIRAADIVLYLWTVLGIAIFLNLLPLNRKKVGKSLVLVLIVVLFSGVDIVGHFIATGGDWPMYPMRIEWWTSFSYTSISGQLLWAPNHSLPMFLGAALFYRHWANPGFLRLAIVFAPLTLIWTPFAILGLLPFFLLYFGARFRVDRPNWPTLTQVLAGLFVGIIVARFLTLSTAGIQGKTGFEHAGSETYFWYAYALFCFCEFGAICLLLGPRLKNSFGILIVSTAILATLPFVFFGPSNDLLLRVSSPALVLIAILAMRAIGDAETGNWHQFPWPLAFVLLIGVCTPINELSRAWLFRHWQPDYKKTLVEVDHGNFPPHYIGHLDRTGFTWFLKVPKVIPGTDRR